MKYLILLTLINFSIITIGCNNDWSHCKYTYKITHCATNQTKEIVDINYCSCNSIRMYTYKEAVPILYHCNREIAVNYCEYKLISKTKIN